MKCQRCESVRLVCVSGRLEYSDEALKHDDLLTNGHCTELTECLNCGQIQGKFDPQPDEVDVRVAMDGLGNWVFLNPR